MGTTIVITDKKLKINVIDNENNNLSPTNKVDMIRRKMKNNNIEVVQYDNDGIPIIVKLKKKRIKCED